MQWNDEIVGLWPTPVMRSQLVDQSVLDCLAELFATRAATSDDGLFASEDAAIQQLRATIAGAVQAYFEHIEVRPAPAWRVRGRFERLAYGESRGLKNTPGAYLSGVLYIRTPRDTEALRLRNDSHPGFLTLFDPRPGFNMLSIRNDPYRNQAMMVEPRPGLFLMWPASVSYYRHPNLSRTPQLGIFFEVVPAEDEDTRSVNRWDGEIQDLWPTGLIKRRLPENDGPNQALIGIIDEMERENPDLTTDFNVDRFRDMKHPAVDWLMSNIERSITAYFRQLGMTYPISWGIASWPNINRFGDYHSPHNHPWSYLSGTYYVQVPEADVELDGSEQLNSASISYYDPRPEMSPYTFPPGSRSSPVFTVTPVSGALLMWPSSVYHFVHPNLSTRKRYSISFNVHLQLQDHYF
jgi:uncharacterized protein (TIGR02466 family)